MTQKMKPARDPWRDLVKTKETNQVEIDEVLVRFSIEDRSAQALKKALIARIAELVPDR